MYGTVARMRVKPGMGDKMMELMREYEDLDVRGHAGTVVYQSDSDPEEYYMAVFFDDADSYRANAESPEQHERYLKYRDVLAGEPDWHDGNVVYQFMR